MNGRASPVGRRIQTNGTRNEKASRLSRDKTTRARKQSTTRTAEGGHPDSERERGAFARSNSLASASSSPACSAARQTNHSRRRCRPRRAGSAVRSLPISRGRSLLKSSPLHFPWGVFFSWFSFLGESLGFFGREGGWGEVLGVAEAILLDRFKCGRPDDSASAGV